jgi:DNA-binding MarR family transcriptional regulator
MERSMNVPINEDLERTQNLVLALGKARNLMAAELNAGLKPLGANLQERGILQALARESVKSPAALSKLLYMHPGRMSRVLDKLERSGLVERTRNGADRRLVDVSLTLAGQERAASDTRHVGTRTSGRLAHFTNSDFEALNGLLCKLLCT